MTLDSVFTGTNGEGRKLLRIEARNAAVPIERKPSWIRTTMKTGIHSVSSVLLHRKYYRQIYHSSNDSW